MSGPRGDRPGSLLDARMLAASVVGLGFVPVMPGTAASALALLLGLGVSWGGLQATWVLGVALVVATGVGFALCRWAEEEAGGRDPGWFVLDEVAGMWLAMWALPGGWLGAGVAFGLFRFLDIVKPPPIRQAEKVLGPGGIMLDDIVAGLLANLMVRAGWLLLG